MLFTLPLVARVMFTSTTAATWLTNKEVWWSGQRVISQRDTQLDPTETETWCANNMRLAGNLITCVRRLLPANTDSVKACWPYTTETIVLSVCVHACVFVCLLLFFVRVVNDLYFLLKYPLLILILPT